MGGWINGLVPEQLPADERIRICELYVSAASLSQIFQCVVADWQRRFLAVVLSHLPVDRVVVGGRLRSWVSVPQNRLAEHSSVLRPHISVLGQLSVGVTGKSTSVLVSIPATVGVYHGARKARISPQMATALTALVVFMMISAWNGNALWVLNWALLLPLSYVVGLAWSSGYPGEASSSWPMSRRISAGTV